MGDELERLADGQHGVFSLSDALRIGVTEDAVRRRLRAGRYERVGPATFRIVGASPTWRQAVMRAVVAAGSGSAAARMTALILHRVARPNGVIEIVTPRRRRLRIDPSVTVHTSRALPAEDVRPVTGIPTTTIERTILDVAGQSHPDRLASYVDAAIAAGLTDVGQLAEFLERRRRRGRPGVSALVAVLERPSLGLLESRYERAFFDLLESAGLEPVPQFEVRDDDGRLVARVDFAFPERQVAIEIDGHDYHATRTQRSRDASRQNRLELMGWSVLRFTSDQVYLDGRRLLPAVRAALAPNR